MAATTIEECISNRSLGRLIWRINKLMLATIEERFADSELSFVQWLSLKRIRDETVGNAGDLAREIEITTGATTRLVDGLEDRGFVRRDRCAQDRRVIRLAITAAGSEALIELAPIMVASWNELLAEFDHQDSETLVSLLEKLLGAFRQKDAAACNELIEKP